MITIIMSRRTLTAKQQQVLEALQGRTDHPTAEEIYRSLRNQGHRTSLATVYRALRALAEDGRVAEVRGLGADRFDPVPSAHYHLFCTRCSGVYDADVPYQDDLDDLPARDRFRVTGHEVTFYGVCGSCSNHKEEHDGQSR